jgi:predicted transcriptional regulator
MDTILAASPLLILRDDSHRLSIGKEVLPDLDSGNAVSHEKVSKWLKTWGKRGE